MITEDDWKEIFQKTSAETTFFEKGHVILSEGAATEVFDLQE